MYTTYYDSSLNKYVVIARVYINGQFQHRRLFFAERQKMTESDDITKNIGIRMIFKMANDIQYQNILGLNVLTIRID